VSLLALEMLSAARSYVAGEGLWSKSQRDAVYYLTLYGQTRDPAYFLRYREALGVPLGDRQARLELEKDDYDYARAYSGFRQGGNNPDDIPGMIRVFRCCAEVSYFARAVAIWRRADEHIAHFEQLGERLRAEVASDAPSRQRIEAILGEVRVVDAEVRPLEEAFTSTLGEAVRWLKSTLVWGVSGVILVLIALGAWIASRTLADIRRTEDKYRIVANAFANTGDGVMILDAQRRIAAVNHAFTAITGYDAAEVVDTALTQPVSVELPGPTLDQVWSQVLATGGWEGEIWNLRKNGEVFAQRLNVSAVRDPGGAASHYVAVFSDISPYKAYEAKLRHLATHDTLTGLPNRAEFERQCRDAIARARRVGRHVAVLFIDLDGFKSVNDACGHAAGDELLQALGARLCSALRATDSVGRLGGDEFGVLLADLESWVSSATVAQKLLNVLCEPVATAKGIHIVGASIGISAFPCDAEDAAVLLQLADAAMYHVKQAGRHGYHFHSDLPPALGGQIA
jgi:diguanylate cyclase (GGDEF)-like protein/PAS domain S-box-containing protein